MNETLRLNLGCGNDYKQGYVNIDWDSKFCNNGIDILSDIRCLPYEQNSVSEIIAEGCLEHLSHRDVMPTLMHWFTILKAAGTLVIETPNLRRILLDEVLQGNGIFNSHPYETLYGGQRNRTEVHLGLWTAEMLGQLMTLVGFKDIIQVKPTKNLDRGEDWNIRLEGKKLYDWSFPFCNKCNKNISSRTQVDLY